ncbi:MAG: hypothetical protein WA981_05130 [Glaciecola sp.]
MFTLCILSVARKTVYSKYCLCIALLLCTLVFTANINAQQTSTDSETNLQKQTDRITTSRYVDGEELLFSLVVDNYALGELNVLIQNQQYYINFEDLVMSAEFAIERSASSRDKQYVGWWANEKNTFELSLPSDPGLLIGGQSNAIAFVVLKGEKAFLNELEVFDIASELYVRADLIEDWFGARFAFDESKLWLNTQTSQAWPFQLSQQRQKTKTNTLSRIPDSVEPHYDPGYSMLSPQTIDFIASVRANRLQSENSSKNANYSLLGRQDIMGLSTRYFMAGNDKDVLTQGTVDFSRHWSEDNKGPLGMTRLQFGDIQPVRVGNISTNATRGVLVSNADLNRRTNQDVTNVSGFVQAGWDVELYQNKVLVKQLFDIQSGRYEFLDLPLFNGLNEFEVIKYGPQGQIEKETFERLLDSSLSDVNNASYEISLSQNNTDTLGIQNISEELSDNLLLSGNYSVGLGSNSSINFAHANQLGDSDLNDQYRLSYVSKLTENAIINSTYTYSPDQFHDLSLSLSSSIWEQLFTSSINIEKSEVSNNAPLLEDYSGNVQISVSGNVFQGKSQSLFQQSKLIYQQNLLGDAIITANNRLAYRTKWFGLNHSIDYRRIEDTAGNIEDSAFGIINSSFNIGSINARAGASYTLGAQNDWETMFVNANWYALNTLSIRAEFSRNLNLDNNSFGLGLDWKHDLYGITARVEHSDLFDTSLTLSARISFSEAPTEFGYIQSKRSLAEYGTVLVRVYHDINNNRIYDAEDMPIKNARVSAIQARRFAETDVIGIAQIDGLSSFRKTDLILDIDSLENPFLVNSTLKTSITPRAGLVTLVNYPLVEGGEVEGEVSFIDEFNRVRNLANVPLVIRDSHGNHIADVKAGFDGYFYYAGLVPHTYYLTVDEDYLNRKNFRAMKPIPLKIEEQGQQLLGADVKLQEKPRVSGYVVLSGGFSSKNLLIAYYELVNSRLSSLQIPSKITPFEHEVAGRKLALGLLFTQDKAEADQLCAQLASVLSSCQVKDHILVL